MILINNLDFRYSEGDFRLTIPEFRIKKSEKVAIIGPSGSGKTTLLNLLSGIITPLKGSIVIGYEHVSQLSDRGRRDFRIANIGFVFQDFELIEYLNVMDNILHPYRITGALTFNGTTKAHVKNLADQMGIGDKLKRHPDDLSQGEKQRAAICRALLPRPSLVLADEATGNLDPENKTRILDLLFRSVEEHEATLLAVTHDHELLKRFDRVIDFKEFQERQAKEELRKL
jgi:putative ABC transport system ATP-binding protein